MDSTKKQRDMRPEDEPPSHPLQEDQIANIPWIMEKAREFQKNIYFCFIDSTKAFDCVDHNKLWKILQEMGYQTTLLASLGEGNGNPLQYSCLENPIDGGTWWATVRAVAESRTRLK